MKLPRIFRLPFCKPITIRYITDKQMAALSGKDLSGMWSGLTEKPTIYVNKDTPLWEQIDTIFHEIKHALIDMETDVQSSLIETMKVEAGQTAVEMREEEE